MLSFNVPKLTVFSGTPTNYGRTYANKFQLVRFAPITRKRSKKLHKRQIRNKKRHIDFRKVMCYPAGKSKDHDKKYEKEDSHMDSDIGLCIEVIPNNKHLGVNEENGGAVVVCAPGYALLVPKEERAEEKNLPEKYDEARKQGVFSSAAGMARIDNLLDGKIHAAIRVDDHGNRTVEFCQQYDNGDFSPKVSVSQADLRFAAMHGFVPEGVPIPRMKLRLGKFLEQVTLDYFGRVSGGVVYEPIEILNTLVAAIDQLPEFRMNGDGWTAETLYAAVMDMINGVTIPPITPFGNHKAFMAFADFQIEAMAQQLEMKSGRELLKLLDQYHLLYIADSSRGYQSKVYIEGTQRDWAYCVYRAEYIAERLRERR